MADLQQRGLVERRVIEVEGIFLGLLRFVGHSALLLGLNSAAEASRTSGEIQSHKEADVSLYHISCKLLSVSVDLSRKFPWAFVLGGFTKTHNLAIIAVNRETLSC
jgi:hypothetical protein